MEQDGLEPNDLKCRHHLSFSMAPSFFVILVYVNSHFLFILWCLCTQSLLLEFFPSHWCLQQGLSVRVTAPYNSVVCLCSWDKLWCLFLLHCSQWACLQLENKSLRRSVQIHCLKLLCAVQSPCHSARSPSELIQNAVILVFAYLCYASGYSSCREGSSAGCKMLYRCSKSLQVELQDNLLDSRSDLLPVCTWPDSACIIGAGVEGSGTH